MKKIAILTSGGDAPGMNAAIRGVVRTGLYYGFEVYGVEKGYEGLIDGCIRPLTVKSVAGIIQHGGTMLKTARSEEFKTIAGQEKALHNLRARDIDVLIVIGGDGSMAGAQMLTQQGLSTMVIPATIDNDMNGTDYTIGFDTALNTVLDAVNKIRDTAESHQRVAIVEVMGRSAGHIALQAGLACGAEAILLPEEKFDIDKLCNGLKQSHRRGKLYSIVMVAEGVAKGYEIAEQIAEKTVFNPHVTVLGYIQRGGSPSAVDNIIGSRMGAKAVESIMLDEYNRLVSWQKGELLTIEYEQAFKREKGIDKSIYKLAAILAT